MGNALALVGLADFDPDEPTPLQRIEVAAHGGAVQRSLSRQARDGQRTKAGERAQHGELGDTKTRGRQSSIIGGRDRTCGASEGAADARCFGCHLRAYSTGRKLMALERPLALSVVRPSV